MSTITAAEVNKLRTMTGAGMMDCKKALTESGGDFEAAIDILRKKGQKVSAARAENTTSEGIVSITVSADGKNGKLVALACETEPVSKVADFKNLSEAIMAVAVAKKPATTEELSALPLADGRTVQEHIIDLTGKIGEKVTITSYVSMDGEQVVPYIHSNGKLGVMVALKNTGGKDCSEAGRDVAMQAAAMKPVALDKDDVDPKTVEREIEIGKEQARAEGKPEAMLEKIALGKLNKFYKDATLLNQEFVKDNSKSISQMLDGFHKGLTVSAFVRISLS
ncbi:translation elongation factor Ts [Cytophaga hutchinsonii]|jgi:elongation factor Ts|uniref:Elongation factor Ts n=1 Tax=Cytophaga hutchinsonii (strain ATCC 33406 / DSM 1761 / CIP 103989 / NBRC 15051 / NCIMB 9469 / D465) TaxID=269798 RepID=EFTS_CYTH3|nr:translation elongation factor Ts [Cytophaga hutchinsonii]Q11QN7.1 RecName: Full=Elongation factor Ts; Short=EF-Ts [Cytophaga hutchinsonii ATCC 33406]ABG60277.1 translation elongation factor Ts (EF-Ts) [Cytophaga hutchinsonii ATCC 33406]SFX20129.1 translation elongation factor Ts (EF-Ts) [Cytophaga hutchinsonii ATCC 33406]